MRVALLSTFRASRKEPLAELLKRVHAGFLDSGEGEPFIRFVFSDAPVAGFVSSVDRVLRRYPQLERFLFSAAVLPGSPAVRQISNRSNSPAAGEQVELDTLLAVAAGVPRSFPFHNLSIQLHSPSFGEALPDNPPGSMLPGVHVSDSWWVNGRNRSLTALTVVEADPASNKLPPPPEPVAVVLAACGKVKSTSQIPLAGVAGPGAKPQARGPTPEVAKAVGIVVRDYRARFAEVLERASLPHDLPSALDVMKTGGTSDTTGPKKPVLDRAFKPMGYKCRGGSGTFALRRKTKANLTVEIDMDVGTWSHSLTASFRVHGLGFTAVLPLPVSRRAMGSGQYPIGDAARWQQIVDNIAALVAGLDRSFVPDIEAVSGPAPEWFTPES